MTKKLYYLFAISLFGTTCMANDKSHPNASPNTRLPERAVLQTKEDKLSENKTALPMTPFWKDIKRHPFPWIASCLVAELFILLINLPFITWIVGAALKFNTLKEFAEFFFKNYSEDNGHSFWEKLGRQLVGVLLTLTIFGILSLLPASWESRWRSDESKKGEGVVMPCFATRFWRSFRFMLIPFIVSIVWKIPVLLYIKKIYNFFYLLSGQQQAVHNFCMAVLPPILLCVGAYVAIVAYEYLRQRKDKEKQDLASNS